MLFKVGSNTCLVLGLATMTKASSIKKERAIWGFWFQRRVYHYQRQKFGSSQRVEVCSLHLELQTEYRE